ncbi:hypothetical protein KY290_010990 [Solanum tuberosum]|uniref:Retrovirus-related Pol polyprotein from transposon TNT 1-94-like beta-barrel domain-containing protein n=1 Tax=Solanum tuberosum TaxID=4113 RepID=A0ABQ7VZD2_SOLTU|nr:hypothetical protein KY290_010990 [Solanum tuberosum]
MAPNITVTNSDANTTIVQFNPVTQLPIKLTGSHNFSLWKAQVSMLMRGHNLFGHLGGSRPAPARTVAQNNQDIENPAFVSWYRQDQLIQNSILASVDPNLAATVVAASTSQAAWDALHTAYANKSQTRIFSLRDRLARLAKETLPVADYLHQVRSLCDELATAGAPVSNEELIVKILTGLGPEFREISAAIRARDSSISYPELYEKLLDHELFIKHEEAKKPLSTPVTAAIAQQTNMHPRQGNTSNRRSNANSPNTNQSRRAQPSRAGNNNQQQRYDHTLKCQLCDRPGHSAKVCRSQSHDHIQARANYAARSPTQQAPWIVDTGATHHMASNAQNFTDVHTYHGPEEIAMGDGNTIPISHTGSEYGGASVSRAESRWAI